MKLDIIEPKQFSTKAKEYVPGTHFSDKLDSINFRESKNWVDNTFKKCLFQKKKCLMIEEV